MVEGIPFLHSEEQEKHSETKRCEVKEENKTKKKAKPKLRVAT